MYETSADADRRIEQFEKRGLLLFIAVTPFLFLPSGGISPLHEGIELVDGDAHETRGQEDAVASGPIDDDTDGFKGLDDFGGMTKEELFIERKYSQ